MSIKNNKEAIKEELSKKFNNQDNISFFFIKKQKHANESETIIPFKTRKTIDRDIISELEISLQKITGRPDLKLIPYNDLNISKSQIFKIPFLNSKDIETKSHPWRICPIGEHWVKRHPKQLLSGKVTDHDGHCRKNRKSKAEYYTTDELNLMADSFFKSIASNPDFMPNPDAIGFKNGNKYDLLIAGWTKFWNEVLSPEIPLSPNLVKALIATESSFDIPKDQKSNDGAARGLIQITENTRKILQNLKGELKNHHIELTTEESREPNPNIAAGIRWLHHKKYLLEKRLKRKASWEEAIYEYKGIYKDIGKDEKTDRIIKKLKKYNHQLTKGEKNE